MARLGRPTGTLRPVLKVLLLVITLRRLYKTHPMTAAFSIGG